MIDYKDPKAVMEICENMPPFAELHNGNYPVELFYTLSREALPYWVAEAERLREENEKLRKELQHHCSRCRIQRISMFGHLKACECCDTNQLLGRIGGVAGWRD